MKRVFFLMMTALLLFATSCKREWTCQCITKEEGVQTDVVHISIKDAKHKEAKEECKSFELLTEEVLIECEL